MADGENTLFVFSVLMLSVESLSTFLRSLFKQFVKVMGWVWQFTAEAWEKLSFPKGTKCC